MPPSPPTPHPHPHGQNMQNSFDVTFMLQHTFFQHYNLQPYIPLERIGAVLHTGQGGALLSLWFGKFGLVDLVGLVLVSSVALHTGQGSALCHCHSQFNVTQE